MILAARKSHCVKSVRIRGYSAHFSAFGVSLRIQSKCGKMRTRITPNTDTFYVVWNIAKSWKNTEDVLKKNKKGN